MQVNNAKVLPIVVGARGALSNESKKNLTTLGISKKEELEDIIGSTLKKSIAIVRSHCDSA